MRLSTVSQGEGQAELNVDFCAAIPVLTITGSFGVPVEEALEVRASLTDPMAVVERLAPIVAARREKPADDLISVLVEAEITEEDGSTHRLSDPDIYSFAMLLLMAGSGTTWKQMGITLAALLDRPALLDAIRQDRSLLKAAIEESFRWMPTDPMFSRWVAEDIDFFGVRFQGVGAAPLFRAASRDPARWENPDRVRPCPPSEARPGFRQWPARLPRHACRPRRDVGRHLGLARSSTQPAARPGRRATSPSRPLRKGSHGNPGGVRFMSEEELHTARSPPAG